MKKTIFFVSIVVMGLLLGSFFMEIILRSLRGDPRRGLAKDGLSWYFDRYRGFFKKARGTNGEWLYITQRNYADPETFPCIKKPGTKRIFILGESTAACFGESKSVYRDLLEKIFPGKKFEIINCGMYGYDITQIQPILKEILTVSPDLVLSFIGNNPWRRWEYVMPNGFSRFLYENTWVYRLIAPKYLNNHLVIHRENPSITYHREILQDMVRACKAKKVPLVLYTLPVNLECPMAFPEALNPIYSKEYFLSLRAMEGEKFPEAVKILTTMARREEYSQNPFVFYSLSRCLLAVGNVAAARSAAFKALQYSPQTDNENWLCPHLKNRMTKKVASQENIPLVDLEKIFAEAAPQGYSGDLFFTDICHWTFSLNPWVFQETLNSIKNFNRTHAGEILAPLSEWKTGADAPRKPIIAEAPGETSNQTFQVGHFNLLQGPFQDFSECYIYYIGKAFAAQPSLAEQDILSKKLAFEMLGWNGKNQIPPELDKKWPRILLIIGETLRRKGKTDLAEQYFNESIRIQGDQVFPYLYRGWIFFSRKDYLMAEKDWQFLMKVEPRFSWLNDILKSGNRSGSISFPAAAERQLPPVSAPKHAFLPPGLSKSMIDKTDAGQPALRMKKQGQLYFFTAPAMKFSRQTYGDLVPYGSRDVVVRGVFWFTREPINVPKRGILVECDGTRDIYVYLTPTPVGKITFYSDLKPVEFRNVMKYDAYGVAFRRKDGGTFIPAPLPLSGRAN